MRQYKGVAVGFTTPVLGRLTTTPQVDDTNSTITLTGDDLFIGAAGNGLKQSASFKFNNLNEMPHEGDVVQLDPSGLCTVLIESASKNNIFLLTECCNSRCITCPQPPKQKDTHDHFGLALSLIDLLPQGIESITLTGGEPTLFWENLVPLIKNIRTKHPDLIVNLLTNGRVLKNYGKVALLAEAGGNKLHVAIPLFADYDDLHDEMTGVKGSFWETVEGLYNLERCNLRIELRFVITRLNFERLPAWAEHVYRFFPFVNHVALMGLEMMGWANENSHNIWAEPREYMTKLIEAARIFNRRGLLFSIYNYPLCILPETLRRFAYSSISEWKRKFFTICENCGQKDCCGGIFNSSASYLKDELKPIT